MIDSMYINITGSHRQNKAINRHGIRIYRYPQMRKKRATADIKDSPHGSVQYQMFPGIIHDTYIIDRYLLVFVDHSGSSVASPRYIF